MSDTGPSLSESVRDHILKEIEEGINFEEQSNRTQSCKRYHEAHPTEKYGSISASFSKQLAKIVKDKGYNPAQFRQKSKIKPKYDPSMNLNINTKPASVQAPTIKNPQHPGGPPPSLNTNVIGQPGMPGAPGAAPLPAITPAAVGSFFAGLYGFFQMIMKDLPPLDKAEQSDLADLWHPIIAVKATSLRSWTLLAVGGTSGIMAKKYREAKAAQKKAEENQKPKMSVPSESTFKSAVAPPPAKEAPPAPAPAPQPEPKKAEPAPDDPLGVYYGPPI